MFESPISIAKDSSVPCPCYSIFMFLLLLFANTKLSVILLLCPHMNPPLGPAYACCIRHDNADVIRTYLTLRISLVAHLKKRTTHSVSEKKLAPVHQSTGDCIMMSYRPNRSCQPTTAHSHTYSHTFEQKILIFSFISLMWIPLTLGVPVFRSSSDLPHFYLMSSGHLTFVSYRFPSPVFQCPDRFKSSRTSPERIENSRRP